MKTNFKIINDYFPLSYDIADAEKKQIPEPANSGLNADELIAWCSENRVTPLQAMILLIKNVFEGHLYLSNIPVESLIAQGTFQMNPDDEIVHKELAVEFSQNIQQYQQGLEYTWKSLSKQLPEIADIDFQSMFYYILANQLFRLPISCIAQWDTHRFSTVSAKQKVQYRFQFQLYISILEHAAQRAYIEQINEKYMEKFKDFLLRLQSKEKVFMQVCTKLDYANDPAVKNHDQLERKYFEFLVTQNISAGSLRGLQFFENYSISSDAKQLHDHLKVQIKKLFKLISKNCSEVHTQTEPNKDYHTLGKYFMTATSLYNEVSLHFINLLLQYSRLNLLLAKVINFRKVNKLPVSISDFTAVNNNGMAYLDEEEVCNCQNSLQKSLGYQRVFHFTDFKSKYVKDDEMAEIHRRFLQGKIEFLDQKIIEVMEEIKLVMLKKTNVSN